MNRMKKKLSKVKLNNTKWGRYDNKLFIPSLKINIYSTATNAKRTPVATVTATEAAAQEDGEIIIN